MEDIKNFLDYNLISLNTKNELNNTNIYTNESLIDEVYDEINKTNKMVKFSGLLFGDIEIGKTTHINNLLKFPKNERGLTGTLTGENLTVSPPKRYNNPDYY